MVIQGALERCRREVKFAWTPLSLDAGGGGLRTGCVDPRRAGPKKGSVDFPVSEIEDWEHDPGLGRGTSVSTKLGDLAWAMGWYDEEVFAAPEATIHENVESAISQIA